MLLLFAVIIENQNIIMAPKEGLFWINLFLFLINIILTFRGLLFAEKRISKRARSGVKYTHLTSSFHSYVNLFLLLPLAQSIITQIKKIKGTSPLIFLIFFFEVADDNLKKKISLTCQCEQFYYLMEKTNSNNRCI